MALLAFNAAIAAGATIVAAAALIGVLIGLIALTAQRNA